MIDRSGIFFAVLSGLLLTASFPSAGLYWIAWAALVPLAASLNDKSFKKGFFLGFLTGIVHYLTLIYWLVGTIRTYGHLPLYLCVPVLIILTAYLALFIGVFSAVICVLRTPPAFCVLLFPALWVILEYLRSHLFSGFPWELIGYSQFQSLYIIQISDMFGVYGVSFLIVLSNTAALMIFLYITGGVWHGKKVAACDCTFSIIVFVAFFCAVYCYGKWRIQKIDKVVSASPFVKVAVVQGNIDQAVKWDPAFQLSTVEKYLKLSKSVIKDEIDLVVWPETAAPFYFISNRNLTDMVCRGAIDTGAVFLIGAPSFAIKNRSVEYYNSAYLIDKKGNICSKYDKAHLVPFGEYVPLGRWLPFINKVVDGIGDFRPGEKGDTLKWGEFRLGIQICYEIIFPHLCAAMAKNNAALIINITNDAWYGRTSAPYQHFSMAIFRAVENRRSIVRAANTGISGFVDPVGRVTAETEIFKEAVEIQTLPLIQEKSIYSQFGDLFVLFCFVITLVFIIACRSCKRRA